MRKRSLGRAIAAGLGLATILIALPAAAEDGWLGVSLQDVDSDLREALDLEAREGVLVSHVIADSPAEEAGIEEGDVILTFDGDDVRSVRGLTRWIRRSEPDDRIPAVILRDGERIELDLVLGERERESRSSWRGWPRVEVHPHAPGPPHPPSSPRVIVPHQLEQMTHYFSRPRLGVETRRLDEDLAGYFGVTAGEGVLVLEVIDDTPAEEIGLLTGDVITAVDGTTVGSPGDLRDLLLDHEGETVSLDIVRKGATQTLEVELDEPTDFLSRGSGLRVFGIGGDDEDELREALEELKEQMKELRDQMRELRNAR